MTWARKLTEWREQQAQRREANLRALCIKPNTLHRGVLTKIADEVIPQPKSEAQRNPHLLQMARGKECLFRIPGICIGGTETTVACHSNESQHGKAGARKADDNYVVYGCAACHAAYDTSRADADTKAEWFRVGSARQVLDWRLTVISTTAPDADRRAAQWALDRLETENA